MEYWNRWFLYRLKNLYSIDIWLVLLHWSLLWLLRGHWRPHWLHTGHWSSLWLLRGSSGVYSDFLRGTGVLLRPLTGHWKPLYELKLTSYGALEFTLTSCTALHLSFVTSCKGYRKLCRRVWHIKQLAVHSWLYTWHSPVQSSDQQLKRYWCLISVLHKGRPT